MHLTTLGKIMNNFGSKPVKSKLVNYFTNFWINTVCCLENVRAKVRTRETFRPLRSKHYPCLIWEGINPFRTGTSWREKGPARRGVAHLSGHVTSRHTTITHPRTFYAFRCNPGSRKSIHQTRNKSTSSIHPGTWDTFSTLVRTSPLRVFWNQNFHIVTSVAKELNDRWLQMIDLCG